MKGLAAALQAPASRRTTTGRGAIPGVWRGTIVETYADGTVAAVIPALLGDQAMRMPCVVAGMVPGLPVLVGAIEGRVDDLVVFGADELVLKGYVDAAVGTRAPASHRHPWADLDNIPATFAPIIGSTGTTAKAGDWFPAWAEVSGKPGTFPPDAHTHAYSALTGIPATFAPSAHTHPMTDLTGVLVPGQLPAATGAAAGSMSAADKSKLDGATSAATVSKIVMRDANGRADFVDPTAGSHVATKGWTDAQIATRAATVHTHTAAQVSDSTTIGRAVLTATDAAAARAATGAGTSSLVIGTGATDAMPGNKTFAYSEITGIVPTAALPPLAVNDVFTVATQAAMLALVAQRGDMAIRTDTGKSYALSTDSPGTLADWKELMAAGQVVSVASKTGVVSLVKADVGLGSVDNTADAAKPVSTPQQTALDLKAPLASPAFTGTPTGISKAHVGLSSVDNTADVDKPISTATQTALNGKQATKVDTGWLSTGLTITPATSWVIDTYKARKVDNMTWIEVAATYSGATLTVAADGNISDFTVFTMPTGYRPLAGNWLLQAVRAGAGTQWFGHITSAGAVQFTHGLPGMTLVSGTQVVVRTSYLLD